MWIAKAEHAGPPKVVQAATAFSAVSFKAVAQGLRVAQEANAKFHLLHVMDSKVVPEDVISKIPQKSSLRQDINEDAQKRLDTLRESLQADRSRLRVHLSWGTPWKESARVAQDLAADVIALGTVGRSGIHSRTACDIVAGLLRVWWGPTVPDRMLAAKLCGATGTAILLLLAEGLSLKQLLTERLPPLVKLLADGGLS